MFPESDEIDQAVQSLVNIEIEYHCLQELIAVPSVLEEAYPLLQEYQLLLFQPRRLVRVHVMQTVYAIFKK